MKEYNSFVRKLICHKIRIMTSEISTMLIDLTSSDDECIVVNERCIIIDVGSVVRVKTYHVDSNRFRSTVRAPYKLYGVVVQWDVDSFGLQNEDRVQVEVVANGEYTVEGDDSNNVTNIVFNVTLPVSEVDVIIQKGTINYIVANDEYGLNPICWVSVDDYGK